MGRACPGARRAAAGNAGAASPVRPRSAGLTLLEMLVTVGVLALAATLAAPRLLGPGPAPLDAAAARLRDALGFAREGAILGGVRWRLVVDLDGGRWAVGRPRPDGAVEPVPGPLAEPVVLPRAVRVAAVRAGGAADARGGTAVLDLAPDGDPFPVAVELRDDRGAVARVVLPAGAARAVVR